jgi:hypothetical protein
VSYDDSDTIYHLTPTGWKTGDAPGDRVESVGKSGVPVVARICWMVLHLGKSGRSPSREGRYPEEVCGIYGTANQG